jgi:hypothetical protein
MKLFSNRNFLVIWFGQLSRIFGGRFSEIAIPLIVLELTGSPWSAALVVICSQIPPLLISIPVGRWIEQKPKRRVAMFSELICIVTLVLLVICVSLDILNVWVLAFSLGIIGATNVFFKISFGVIVPQIVGRSQLVKAHSYLEGADAVGTLFGPVLAGTILAAYGIATTLSVEGLTYLISFTALALISIKERKEDHDQFRKAIPIQKKVSVFSDVKYLFANRYQIFVSVNQVILSFTTISVNLSVIFYSNQILFLNEWETGLILTGAGAGNLLGVFLLSKLEHFQWRYLFSGLMFISGIGLLTILLSNSLYQIILGMFIFDGALSMAFVVNGAARQAITPDHYLSRIGGGGFLLSGLIIAFGTLFSGKVSDLFSPLFSIAICCVLVLFGAIYSMRFKQGNQSISNLSPIELLTKN